MHPLMTHHTNECFLCLAAMRAIPQADGGVDDEEEDDGVGDSFDALFVNGRMTKRLEQEAFGAAEHLNAWLMGEATTPPPLREQGQPATRRRVHDRPQRGRIVVCQPDVEEESPAVDLSLPASPHPASPRSNRLELEAFQAAERLNAWLYGEGMTPSPLREERLPTTNHRVDLDETTDEESLSDLDVIETEPASSQLPSTSARTASPPRMAPPASSPRMVLPASSPRMVLPASSPRVGYASRHVTLSPSVNSSTPVSPRVVLSPSDLPTTSSRTQPPLSDSDDDLLSDDGSLSSLSDIEPEQHECPECGKVCSKAHFLRRHMEYRHGTSSKSTTDGHDPSPHSPPPSFVCPSCRKAFRTQNILNSHLLSHMPNTEQYTDGTATIELTKFSLERFVREYRMTSSQPIDDVEPFVWDHVDLIRQMHGSFSQLLVKALMYLRVQYVKVNQANGEIVDVIEINFPSKAADDMADLEDWLQRHLQ